MLRAQPLHSNPELSYPDLYQVQCGLIQCDKATCQLYPWHQSSTFFNRREQSHTAPCITSRLVREQLAPRRVFLRSRWSLFDSLFLWLKSWGKISCCPTIRIPRCFALPLCWINAWIPCDTPTLQQISLKSYARHCAASFKVNSYFFALATRPPQHIQPVRSSSLSDGKS